MKAPPGGQYAVIRTAPGFTGAVIDGGGELYQCVSCPRLLVRGDPVEITAKLSDKSGNPVVIECPRCKTHNLVAAAS